MCVCVCVMGNLQLHYSSRVAWRFFRAIFLKRRFFPNFGQIFYSFRTPTADTTTTMPGPCSEKSASPTPETREGAKRTRGAKGPKRLPSFRASQSARVLCICRRCVVSPALVNTIVCARACVRPGASMSPGPCVCVRARTREIEREN